MYYNYIDRCKKQKEWTSTSGNQKLELRCDDSLYGNYYNVTNMVLQLVWKPELDINNAQTKCPLTVLEFKLFLKP